MAIAVLCKRSPSRPQSPACQQCSALRDRRPSWIPSPRDAVSPVSEVEWGPDVLSGSRDRDQATGHRERRCRRNCGSAERGDGLVVRCSCPRGVQRGRFSVVVEALSPRRRLGCDVTRAETSSSHRDEETIRWQLREASRAPASRGCAAYAGSGAPFASPREGAMRRESQRAVVGVGHVILTIVSKRALKGEAMRRGSYVRVRMAFDGRKQ